MIYGATGTTNISKMVAAFDNTIPIDRNEAFLLAGVALLVVGFAIQGRRRAVPRVDTRRVRGRPDPDHRVDGVGRQDRRIRRAAAGARRRPRLLPRRLAARDLGARHRRRWWSARSSPSCRRTSSACSPTRRSATPGSCWSASRRQGITPVRRTAVPECQLSSCTSSPTPCSWSARSASWRSSPAATTTGPTSTRSVASASASPRSRSRSRCSSWPRPACRSRVDSSPSSVSSAPPSTRRATRSRSSPCSLR